MTAIRASRTNRSNFAADEFRAARVWHVHGHGAADHHLYVIFLPVAMAFGVRPLSSASCSVLNAGIGLIMPRVGSVLFRHCVGRISIAETMKTIWPFYIAGLVVQPLVTYLPALSL